MSDSGNVIQFEFHELRRIAYDRFLANKILRVGRPFINNDNRCRAASEGIHGFDGAHCTYAEHQTQINNNHY